MKIQMTAITLCFAMLAEAIAKPEEPRASKKPAHTTSTTPTLSQHSPKIMQLVKHGISKKALEKGLQAHAWAVKKHTVPKKNLLTIVDFSLPSTERRFFVIDLDQQALIMKEYTSQGSGSGRGTMATAFSDTEGSHQSVTGVMITKEIYYGKHGKSLRLSGLEKRDIKVEQRDIVIHSAYYVTPHFINHYHRAGNSWGCFALDPAVAGSVIERLKNGSIIFSYAPDVHFDYR